MQGIRRAKQVTEISQPPHAVGCVILSVGRQHHRGSAGMGGLFPPAASTTASSASQVSSARSLSPAGIRGSAAPVAFAFGATHAASRSPTAVTLGLSRRVRYLATASPGALRRSAMMTARSSIVSGMAPIPASTTKANVGQS